MMQVRFLPPAAKFIKKLKDKKLKELYKKQLMRFAKTTRLEKKRPAI